MSDRDPWDPKIIFLFAISLTINGIKATAWIGFYHVSSKISEEIEDLAGNAMNCKAAAAAWVCAFACVSLERWHQFAKTATDIG